MSSNLLPLKLLPQTAVHTRPTDILVTAGTTFPFTSTLNVTFPTEGVVMILATGGIAATLNVDITGELDGTPQTETLSILHTGSKMARSAKRWTKITEIKVDETQAGSLEALSRTLENQPLTVNSVINTALKVRMRLSQLAIPEVEGAGRQFTERFVGYTRETNVRFGDKWTVDSVTYEIEHAVPVYGRRKQHHTEVRLRRVA